MTRFRWMSFYDPAQLSKLHTDGSIYFRYKPRNFDWVLLILMVMLNVINILFVNENEANNFSIRCYEGIRDRYTKIIYRLTRFKNFISSFLIFIVLGILIFFIGKAQTNLISSIFFTLNITNLSFIAKADNKKSTNMRIYNLTNFIKFFAAAILLLDILFIFTIGEMPRNDPTSLDRKFADLYPILYDNLDLVGFRIYDNQSNPMTD